MAPTLTHGTGNAFTLTHQSMDKGGWWDPSGHFHEGFDQPGGATLTHGADTGKSAQSYSSASPQQQQASTAPIIPPTSQSQVSTPTPGVSQVPPPITGLKAAALSDTAKNQISFGPQFTSKPLNGLKSLASSNSISQALNLIPSSRLY